MKDPAEQNPKAETRRPKEVRNLKSEKRRGACRVGLPLEGHPDRVLLGHSMGHGRGTENSAFGFRPSFGLRDSGFGFDLETGSTSTTKSKECPRYVA